MQISRHHRLNANRYRLIGSQGENGLSIQPPSTDVIPEHLRTQFLLQEIREKTKVDPRVKADLAKKALLEQRNRQDDDKSLESAAA